MEVSASGLLAPTIALMMIAVRKVPIISHMNILDKILGSRDK